MQEFAQKTYPKHSKCSVQKECLVMYSRKKYK
jgi:hypothetical protein